MAAIVHTRTRADAAFSSQTASTVGVAAMLSISSCANRAATSLGATTSARSSGATSSSTRQPVRHPPRRSLVVSKATGVGGGDDDDDDDVKLATAGGDVGRGQGPGQWPHGRGERSGSEAATSRHRPSGATRREREAGPPPSTPRNPSALAADIAREFRGQVPVDGRHQPRDVRLVLHVHGPGSPSRGWRLARGTQPAARAEPAGQGQRRRAVLVRAGGGREGRRRRRRGAGEVEDDGQPAGAVATADRLEGQTTLRSRTTAATEGA